MWENATEGVTGMTWDGFKSMSMIMIMIKTRITTITIPMILYDFLQYDTITILQNLTVVYRNLQPNYLQQNYRYSFHHIFNMATISLYGFTLRTFETAKLLIVSITTTYKNNTTLTPTIYITIVILL